MNWKHYGVLAVSLLIAVGPGLEAWLNQHGQSPGAIALQGVLALLAARFGIMMIPPEKKASASVPPLTVLAFAFGISGVSLFAPSTTACKGGLPDPTPVTSTLPPLGVCAVQAALSDLAEAIQNPLSLVTAIMAACSSYGQLTVEALIGYVESAIEGQPKIPATDGAVLTEFHASRLSRVLAAARSQQHIVIVNAGEAGQ